MSMCGVSVCVCLCVRVDKLIPKGQGKGHLSLKTLICHVQLEQIEGKV